MGTRTGRGTCCRFLDELTFFFCFSVSVYFFGVHSGVDKARCPLVELRVADLFLFVVIRGVFDKYFETRLDIICLKQ